MKFVNSPKPISPIKATEQTVYMEEEASAKVVKSASKLQYPVPSSQKERGVRESKLKLEVDKAIRQAKEVNSSM